MHDASLSYFAQHYGCHYDAPSTRNVRCYSSMCLTTDQCLEQPSREKSMKCFYSCYSLPCCFVSTVGRRSSSWRRRPCGRRRNFMSSGEKYFKRRRRRGSISIRGALRYAADLRCCGRGERALNRRSPTPGLSYRLTTQGRWMGKRSIDNVSGGLLFSVLVVKRVEITTMRGTKGDSGVTDQIRRCLHRVTGFATEALVKTLASPHQGFTSVEETCDKQRICQEFLSFPSDPMLMLSIFEIFICFYKTRQLAFFCPFAFVGLSRVYSSLAMIQQVALRVTAEPCKRHVGRWTMSLLQWRERGRVVPPSRLRYPGQELKSTASDPRRMQPQRQSMRCVDVLDLGSKYHVCEGRYSFAK